MRSARLAFASLATVILSSAVAGATPCPNVMFVLDRSGSMAEDPSGGSSSPTKWELLQTAVKQIVTMYGGQLPFGMEMYTTSNSDDASCYLDTMINVEPGHDTAQNIISMIMAAQPDSLTDTAQAIRRARNDNAMHDASRGQYIILITDGDPNCPSDDDTNAMYTIAEITQAAQQATPIHTYVIGFDGSGGVNPANLNGMAKAGLEPQKGCTGTSTSPCYYSASNAAKFNAALSSILTTIAMGEFGGGMCDDSCASNGCPQGQICSTDETNPQPHCVIDPCAGVTNCAAGDYCRNGACVHACLTTCGSNQMCVDGNCVNNPCVATTCGTSQICDPTSGACVSNQCLNHANCAAGTICDPITGQCVVDQCRVITCPAGTECQAGGNCEAVSGAVDGGTGGRGRSTVGCAVSHGAGDASAVLALFALVAIALIARRKS